VEEVEVAEEVEVVEVAKEEVKVAEVEEVKVAEEARRRRGVGVRLGIGCLLEIQGRRAQRMTIRKKGRKRKRKEARPCRSLRRRMTIQVTTTPRVSTQLHLQNHQIIGNEWFKQRLRVARWHRLQVIFLTKLICVSLGSYLACLVVSGN